MKLSDVFSRLLADALVLLVVTARLLTRKRDVRVVDFGRVRVKAGEYRIGFLKSSFTWGGGVEVFGEKYFLYDGWTGEWLGFFVRVGSAAAIILSVARAAPVEELLIAALFGRRVVFIDRGNGFLRKKYTGSDGTVVFEVDGTLYAVRIDGARALVFKGIEAVELIKAGVLPGRI